MICDSGVQGEALVPYISTLNTRTQFPENTKALNTVLAFVSSRKNLATTFPVVRSSVESLLKQ